MPEQGKCDICGLWKDDRQCSAAAVEDCAMRRKRTPMRQWSEERSRSLGIPLERLQERDVMRAVRPLSEVLSDEELCRMLEICSDHTLTLGQKLEMMKTPNARPLQRI